MSAPPNRPDDYVSEGDLVALGIDPALVRVLCPWAVELAGHDGTRCWVAADLTTLLGEGAP